MFGSASHSTLVWCRIQYVNVSLALNIKKGLGTAQSVILKGRDTNYRYSLNALVYIGYQGVVDTTCGVGSVVDMRFLIPGQ